jgi:hypothetical protein
MYSLDFQVGDLVTVRVNKDKVLIGLISGDRFKYDVPEWTIATSERKLFFPKASKSQSLVGERQILKGRFTLEQFIKAVELENE